ncbi:MAG: AAA family ATPase, partial [Halohasta sp.]
DIEAVCREASMAASREFIGSVSREEVAESVGNVRVTMDHFEDALDQVTASVTAETRERYDEIERKFGQSEVDTDDELGPAFQ